ncbi:MAG: replication initiation protein [Romboutsia sp.]|uniref:replication initiation protein n=1 Tax=Romboutsia sp. TaxID=1965302 RepID=UPI003F327BED
MKTLNVKKTKEDVLMKHNTLVAARYSLTPNECRAFTYLLYKIQKSGNMNDEKSCIITKEEFKTIISDKNKSSSKGIKTILQSLKKNDIYLKEKKDKKNNYVWSEYSFISGFEYDDEFDSFKVICAQKVYDILMKHDYKNDGFYTPINLLIWLQFRLNSTQRIYELLRLWSNTKSTVTYTVQELREFMMLENKYEQYRDLKKRILLPAMKELKEVGKIEVEMKENRINRQVISIDFVVKDLDKRKYFNDINLISETKTEIKKSEISEIKSDDKINPPIDFHVPNKKLFTAKTLSDFVKDFNKYNFKDTEYKKLLQESILIALDKGDEEKIKVNSYNYFKKILENKIDELILGKSKENKGRYNKTKFHNFTETYTKYSDDELDDIIENSQKQKYKQNK